MKGSEMGRKCSICWVFFGNYDTGPKYTVYSCVWLFDFFLNFEHDCTLIRLDRLLKFQPFFKLISGLQNRWETCFSAKVKIKFLLLVNYNILLNLDIWRVRWFLTYDLENSFGPVFLLLFHMSYAVLLIWHLI